MGKYTSSNVIAGSNRKLTIQEIENFVKNDHVVEVSITEHRKYDEITYWTLEKNGLDKEIKNIGSIIEKIKAGDKLYSLDVQVFGRRK